MDRWFDYVNAGFQQHNPKKTRQPYYESSDRRLKWLEEDFINYLDLWEERVNQRELHGEIQREKMKLSKPTRVGLRIASKSMVALVRETLGAGAAYVLPRRLNQDPLESYFGAQRQRGFRAGNPTACMFSYNARSLDLLKTNKTP